MSQNTVKVKNLFDFSVSPRIRQRPKHLAQMLALITADEIEGLCLSRRLSNGIVVEVRWDMVETQ